VKAPAWGMIGKVIAVCIAGGWIALLYRFGLADIGGVLILSAIIVSAITFVRSGVIGGRWRASLNWAFGEQVGASKC
jgi:hypothetical protein